MAEARRATVTVMCSVIQGLQLHIHKPIDFGKGDVQARLINEPVVLKPGLNQGIDKEFFDAWKAQNENLAVIDLITATDEAPPETAQTARPAQQERPMDIDAMHKHVQGLMKIKERTARVLEWAEAQMKAGAPQEPGQDAAAVTASEDSAALRSALTDMGEHVASIQQVVDESADAIRDGLAGLKDMADWFAQNREGLEVLLSMGDDLGTVIDADKRPNETAGLITGPAAANVDVDQSGNTEFQPSAEGGPAPGGGSMISGADLGTALTPAAGGPGGPDVANMADAAARGAAGSVLGRPASDAPAQDQGGPGAALSAHEVEKDPLAVKGPNADPALG